MLNIELTVDFRIEPLFRPVLIKLAFGRRYGGGDGKLGTISIGPNDPVFVRIFLGQVSTRYKNTDGSRLI